MNFRKILLITFATVLLSISAFGADRALVIGIDHYYNEEKCNSSMSNLSEGCVTPTYGGVEDALAMKRLLQNKFEFNKNNIHVLTESDATASNIRDKMKNWVIKETNRGDRVFIFYSGHGARIEDDGDDEDDERDEILAPYDIQTRPSIANFIRDDEINEWLAALSDRQVVMVIDSCHSGTISRSMKSKGEKFSKYLITENVPISRGGFADIFSKVPKESNSRDMSTVVDKYMAGRFPNVVVISAAQAYQQAMWFDTNGGVCGKESANPKYRGALAYLFEKIYARKNPTMKQLDRELKNEMLNIGKDGTQQLCPAETGYQIPVVEFQPAMANETMWGMTNSSVENWENEAIAALQNPLSKIIVNLSFDSHNNSYRIGDTIKYSVDVSESAYIYVAVFSQSNVATVIFPWSENKENQLEPGKKLNLEGLAGKPLGKDIWVVIASKNKITRLEPDHLKDYPVKIWDDVFKRIGTNGLQDSIKEIARTRGVTRPDNKLNGADWQTTTAVMETLPKQSN